MSNWSDKDIELFKKLNGIVSRGYYLSGNELAELHNRVFNSNLRPTGCTSCNKMRFQALKKSYEAMMSEIEKQEKQEN